MQLTAQAELPGMHCSSRQAVQCVAAARCSTVATSYPALYQQAGMPSLKPLVAGGQHSVPDDGLVVLSRNCGNCGNSGCGNSETEDSAAPAAGGWGSTAVHHLACEST